MTQEYFLFVVRVYELLDDLAMMAKFATWIQLRSAILVLMQLLAMVPQKIPYEVF